MGQRDEPAAKFRGYGYEALARFTIFVPEKAGEDPLWLNKGVPEGLNEKIREVVESYMNEWVTPLGFETSMTWFSVDRHIEAER